MILPTCVIKLLELCLTIACLTLHQYSYDLTDLPTLMLCSGTYICFVVILTGEIIGEAVSAGADAYVDAVWAATGSVLFATCGALTLLNWRHVPACARRSHAMATAICALINAAILAVDALLAACTAGRDALSSSSNSSQARSQRTQRARKAGHEARPNITA